MICSAIVTASKGLLGAIIACLCFLFGEIDIAFQTLIVFIVADFVIGVIVALIRHEIESRKAWIGFGKKVLTLLVVALSWQIDKMMGTTYVHLIATYGYIGSEAFSIIENLGRAGVPLPAKLMIVFKQFAEKMSGGDEIDPTQNTHPPEE